MPIHTSGQLQLGQVYTRVDLQNLFAITDNTIKNGVFPPRNHDSIWLFITEDKPSDMTPYRDHLEGDLLYWDGQTMGRTDRQIIDHACDGHELLVFYRREKKEFPGGGFRYLGRFAYQSHTKSSTGDGPSHFVLKALDPVTGLLDGRAPVPHIPSFEPAALREPDVELPVAPLTLPVHSDITAICQAFGQALTDSHITFGQRHDEIVRAFAAALATKRFAILAGLSGSGKTQIALRFGRWLGSDLYKLIPVRPDWTGAEALFGYPDALQPQKDGRREWFVPDALAFMLRAARDPQHPYLLILDEMNLAHVERYFADILSGMESGEPCLPNLRQEDGRWYPVPGAPERIAVPPNFFVVGTVNVDETTYMFSPKVLDRASTFEFRVETDDLLEDARKPVDCPAGAPALVRGFLAIALDEDYHRQHAPAFGAQYAAHLRTVHKLLAAADFEFGHRVFYEAIRFAALLAKAGETTLERALDLQIMQKILPRLHGNRRRLESLLTALGRFCYDLQTQTEGAAKFDLLVKEAEEARLPLAFGKLRRMMRSLHANQFASFTE